MKVGRNKSRRFKLPDQSMTGDSGSYCTISTAEGKKFSLR